MSPVDDTRERVVALEIEVQHLTKKVDEMRLTVNEIHGFLQQAKGARWAIVAAAGLGGFISAKLAPFLPWLSTGGK